MSSDATYQVAIQKFSDRGYGVGFAPISEGKKCEVEIAHTVPGDVALIEMRRKMRPPRKGRLLEILSASEDRVEPRCSHARICGGCSWQQIDYKAQLRKKEQIVSTLFQLPVEPIIPCDDPFAYRNKMEFSFSENRAGHRFLGLMIAQAEPYVFNVDACHLCKPWFSEVLCAVRKWWEQSGLPAYNPRQNTGLLRYLTLRESVHTGQRMAILNLANVEEMGEPFRGSFVQVVKQASIRNISIFLRIHEANRGKPTVFREECLSGPDHLVEELHVGGRVFSFAVSPSSFFQPNTRQAEKLYAAALAKIASFDRPLIYDLYCGTGTLGMVAAPIASEVIGIELSLDSIRDAKANGARNGLTNLTFYQGDVGKVLTHLMADPHFRRPEVVFVDPPRAGLDPLALHHIKLLQPKGIVYVSCNPVTQAANVRELISAGYSLKSLQPVDQFPHTYHVENIAYLER